MQFADAPRSCPRRPPATSEEKDCESRMPEFHPDRPKNPKCPPDEAQPANGMVWRGVPIPPLSEEHFKSHVEANLPNCNPENCTHWGLSIWVSEDHVHHARKIHKYMRRWHIASGTIGAEDGVIMPTPSTPQPFHHTWWKYHEHLVADKFAIVMQPVAPPQQAPA